MPSMGSTNKGEFHDRTVNKLTQIMMEGTPNKTQPAAIGVLEDLSSNKYNVSKMIFSSRSTNTGASMSQEVANVLVNAEKIRRQNK
jgi:hypothetical protein